MTCWFEGSCDGLILQEHPISIGEWLASRYWETLDVDLIWLQETNKVATTLFSEKRFSEVGTPMICRFTLPFEFEAMVFDCEYQDGSTGRLWSIRSHLPFQPDTTFDSSIN